MQAVMMMVTRVAREMIRGRMETGLVKLVSVGGGTVEGGTVEGGTVGGGTVDGIEVAMVVVDSILSYNSIMEPIANQILLVCLSMD